MRRASVLPVYAHTDDELFHGGGMLAHLAPRGARVTRACATKGEAGKVHPSVGPVADVGGLRAQEELFTPGATRGPVPRWPLRDLFDGVESGEFSVKTASG